MTPEAIPDLSSLILGAIGAPADVSGREIKDTFPLHAINSAFADLMDLLVADNNLNSEQVRALAKLKNAIFNHELNQIPVLDKPTSI